MIARLNKLAKHIDAGKCPQCGLPMSGPVAKIVRLRDDEPDPQPCKVCGSRTLLIVRTRVVQVPAGA